MSLWAAVLCLSALHSRLLAPNVGFLPYQHLLLRPLWWGWGGRAWGGVGEGLAEVRGSSSGSHDPFQGGGRARNGGDGDC